MIPIRSAQNQKPDKLLDLYAYILYGGNPKNPRFDFAQPS